MLSLIQRPSTDPGVHPALEKDNGQGQALTCHTNSCHLPHRTISQGCHVCQDHSDPSSWWPSSLISNRFPPPGSAGVTPTPADLQSASSYCHNAEASNTGLNWTEMDEHVHETPQTCWIFFSNYESCFNTFSTVSLIFVQCWSCGWTSGCTTA